MLNSYQGAPTDRQTGSPGNGSAPRRFSPVFSYPRPVPLRTPPVSSPSPPRAHSQPSPRLPNRCREDARRGAGAMLSCREAWRPDERTAGWPCDRPCSEERRRSLLPLTSYQYAGLSLKAEGILGSRTRRGAECAIYTQFPHILS